MALAPRVGPVASLQTAAVPPPSSSVNTTFVPAWLNVAECQNAKLTVSRTRLMTRGASGLLMSIRMPSPMHAPAMILFVGYAVRSWQPDVSRLGLPDGLPPSGNSTGVDRTAAWVGARSGTLMIETRSCGGMQSGNVACGPYEET